MYDLIIIGGGAASQAAAMYAIGKNLNFVMVCEQLGGRSGRIEQHESDYLVGDIMVHLDFPDVHSDEERLIGSSAVHLFERQITLHDERIVHDRVLKVEQNNTGFAVKTASGNHQSATVIVATGAAPTPFTSAKVPAQFVRNVGHTVTTHAHAVQSANVAVIGSTDRALYCAAELAQTAAKVYLVAPGPLDPAKQIVSALRQHGSVEILEACTVLEANGSDQIEQLVVIQADETRYLPVQIAFADLGLQPNVTMIAHLVETNADGFIAVDQHNATAVPGLFAAGDVTYALGEQVLIAIGEGTRAAVSAHRHLLEQRSAQQFGA